MQYLITSYRSRTETLGFYRVLLKNGISAEIVNTPKEANIGCGLSVKTNKYYYEILKKAVHRFNGKSFSGVFLVSIANNKKIVRPI